MYRPTYVQFVLGRNPGGTDLRIMVKGPARLRTTLVRAFPSLEFTKAFPDKFAYYDWGVFIKRVGAAEEADVAMFCELVQGAIFLDDDLDETFALAFHTQRTPAGRYEKTALGQLVYAAKPYHRPSSPYNTIKARELAEHMARFIQAHAAYRRADLIAPVPPSNPYKDFDLPTVLAQETGRLTRQAVEQDSIRKVRTTLPMKDCQTDAEKAENIKGAYSADAAKVKGRAVILIDDIYDSGHTINEAARTVRNAGGHLVLGLVATKTSQS